MNLKVDVWNDKHAYEIRRQDTDDKEQMALYSVVVVTPHKGTETHYVLAPSEPQAIGMAECAMGIGSFITPEHIYKLVKSYATRLPLTIQGWGKAKF